MRTIPPKQIKAFIECFDEQIRQGYTDLLGTEMSDDTWRIAKLSPKLGGMGWRTGLQSFGGQYLTSIAKNADMINMIVPEWKATELVMRDANEWLTEHAGPSFDAITALRTIQAPKVALWLSHKTGNGLSLAQK